MVLQTYVFKKQVRDSSFLTQSVSLGFDTIILYNFDVIITKLRQLVCKFSKSVSHGDDKIQ